MVIQKEIIQAAGIPSADVQRLEEAWATFQSAKNQSVRSIPHIVCTGIYNAGKSTLLNALMGEEKFPTGDVPTTKAVARAEFGGAVYIDTPGLNAAEEDDQETQSAYETADFILFVASAQNGGISEAEVAWLWKLQDRYTADGLRQRLVYVLTKCGQIDPEQLPDVIKRFQKDLEQMVGFGEVIPVDSLTYQKGIAEGKQLLVAHSGIDELKKRIAEKVASANELLAQAQEIEVIRRWQETLEQIKKVRVTVQTSKDEADQKNHEKVAAVDKAWAEFEKSLGR